MTDQISETELAEELRIRAMQCCCYVNSNAVDLMAALQTASNNVRLRDLLLQAADALMRLVGERDMANAQMRGVGYVLYLDRMKELAARAERAEARAVFAERALIDACSIYCPRHGQEPLIPACPDCRVEQAEARIATLETDWRVCDQAPRRVGRDSA